MKIKYQLDSIKGWVRDLEKRINKLEDKQPPPDDWIWISMDRNKQRVGYRPLWHKPIWDEKRECWVGKGGMHYGNFYYESQKAPAGLQPGMLCKAKKIEWSTGKPGAPILERYKILSVEQCNLPIDEVDWRDCKYFNKKINEIHYSCVRRDFEKKECWFKAGERPCVNMPHLKDTDIMITCEFEEHKEKREPIFGDRETLIALGVNKINDHQTLNCLHGYVICPDKSATPYSVNVNACTERNKQEICRALGIPYPFKRKRKTWTCDVKQPKLITLDVLKERGVSCKWALDLFRDRYGDKGCTLQELIQNIALIDGLTHQRRYEAICFVTHDLWDFA